MYTRNTPHEPIHRSNADHMAGRNGISRNAPVQGKFVYHDSPDELSMDQLLKLAPVLVEQNYALVQLFMRDDKLHQLEKGKESEMIQQLITGYKGQEDGGLPKIIHFIWIGASIPASGKANVLAWKQRNPGAQIWLWSDSRWHDRTNRIQNGYGEMAAWAGENGIVIKDISADASIFTPHYQKEAGYVKRSETDPNDTWTNFGTASDLARYSILSKYGGIYSDSDLGFREKEVESEPKGDAKEAEEPDIFEEVKRKIYKTGTLVHNRGQLKNVTNDLIASLPGAENIKLIGANAEKKLDLLYQDADRLKEYPDVTGKLYSARALETMATTGPEEMRNVLRVNSRNRGVPANLPLENQQYFSAGVESRISPDDLSIRVPSLKVSDFEGSDMSWLNNITD